MEKKIRVLVVDDSAVVRQSLSSILESDPDIEVMGTAADPIIAVKKIMKEIPDKEILIIVHNKDTSCKQMRY